MKKSREMVLRDFGVHSTPYNDLREREAGQAPPYDYEDNFLFNNGIRPGGRRRGKNSINFFKKSIDEADAGDILVIVEIVQVQRLRYAY